MNLLLIAGIILVVLVIAAAVLKAKSGASEGTAKPDVYYLKKSLFTPAEPLAIDVSVHMNTYVLHR